MKETSIYRIAEVTRRMHWKLVAQGGSEENRVSNRPTTFRNQIMPVAQLSVKEKRCCSETTVSADNRVLVVQTAQSLVKGGGGGDPKCKESRKCMEGEEEGVDWWEMGEIGKIT